jgi:hypothetical protein
MRQQPVEPVDLLTDLLQDEHGIRQGGQVARTQEMDQGGEITTCQAPGGLAGCKHLTIPEFQNQFSSAQKRSE